MRSRYPGFVLTLIWPLAAALVLVASNAAWPTANSPSSQDSASPAIVLAADAKELALTKGLAVGLIGLYGRSAVASDLLAWQMAQGTMAAPRAGVVVGKNAKGEDAGWAAVEAGKEGWIENQALSGGYLYMAIDSTRPRTMILDATGFYVAWINGEPRGGEKYGADYLRHPVSLKKGRNELLFRGERGRFKGRLYEPPADVFFTDKDMTLPDLVLGERGPVWAGLRLVNATGERLERIEVLYRIGGREEKAAIGVSVAPLLTQKLAVPLAIDAPATEGAVKIEVRARARAGRRTVETPPFAVELRAVSPSAHHSRTFVSGIDGSVQYFGVVPMTKGEDGDKAGPAPTKPALVLTLHGASVEGIGQARAYKPKDWCWIAAATNRRPYGFDWEDWGRLDALEVLAEAQRLFGTDPDRTYLTGHSMGGHGTWQIGATVPGPWAAIAPSAGWHSFSSYGGGAVFKDPTPVETMLARANTPSETMGLARNFLHYGIYVLHGDMDDNVPVTQARDMRALLGKFHPDFIYYERPGAGHWWGNECVDWPPLFQFLKERVRPADAEVKRIEFVTAKPGISARSRWVGILAQKKPLELSRVVIERDEAGRAFKGTTENVERLAIDILPAAPKSEAGTAAGGEAQEASGRKAGDVIAIELDGTRVEIAFGPWPGTVYLESGEKGWVRARRACSRVKRPAPRGRVQGRFPARLRVRLRHAWRLLGGRPCLRQSEVRRRDVLGPRQRGHRDPSRHGLRPGQGQGPERHPLRQRRHERRLGEAPGGLAGRGPERMGENRGEAVCGGGSRGLSRQAATRERCGFGGCRRLDGESGLGRGLAGPVLHQRGGFPRPAVILGGSASVGDRRRPGRRLVRQRLVARARRHRLERRAGEIAGQYQ